MNAIAANLFAVMTVAMVKFDERRNNDKGAVMVEYALLVAALAVIIGGLTAVFKPEVEAAFAAILK